VNFQDSIIFDNIGTLFFQKKCGGMFETITICW